MNISVSYPQDRARAVHIYLRLNRRANRMLQSCGVLFLLAAVIVTASQRGRHVMERGQICDGPLETRHKDNATYQQPVRNHWTANPLTPFRMRHLA